MLVSEKESYWDYLTQFFVQAYGKPPYVRRDNYIELTPYTGRSFLFSPSETGGTRYLDFSEHFHTRTLSKIYFYTGTDDFGSLYEESYSNPSAEAVGFQKELYIHPTRSWVTEHEKYADYLFYKSMVDSRAVEVTLPAGMILNRATESASTGETAWPNPYMLAKPGLLPEKKELPLSCGCGTRPATCWHKRSAEAKGFRVFPCFRQ